MELNHHDINWSVRHLPDQVRTLMKKHDDKLFLAGGYIRSMVTGEPVSDIDLFTSSKDFAVAVAGELHREVGGKKSDWHQTEYAYSVHVGRTSVQFIHRWVFATPAECIQSFDFTIAKAAIWWDEGEKAWKSLCDESYYPDLAAKRLVYMNPIRNEDAGGSILRVLKFYQRGYRIPIASLAAVIARLITGIDFRKMGGNENEEWIAKVITGLLYEVDPNADPNHEAH